MNWQAVIEFLREEVKDYERRADNNSGIGSAMVMQTACTLQSIANALQMGLNKKEPS